MQRVKVWNRSERERAMQEPKAAPRRRGTTTVPPVPKQLSPSLNTLRPLGKPRRSSQGGAAKAASAKYGSAPRQEQDILGAVNVKDGLFVGDQLSAHDIEFLLNHKVSHVVNCAGREVPNSYESIGIQYLTYFWPDHDKQLILDNRDQVANDVAAFIQESVDEGESVLIHSFRGQSRSCCIIAAYLMKRYQWSLQKTIEYLTSRRGDIRIKPGFIQQLKDYETRLFGPKLNRIRSVDWTGPVADLDSEQLLLRNAYINSRKDNLASTQPSSPSAHPFGQQFVGSQAHTSASSNGVVSSSAFFQQPPQPMAPQIGQTCTQATNGDVPGALNARREVAMGSEQSSGAKRQGTAKETSGSNLSVGVSGATVGPGSTMVPAKSCVVHRRQRRGGTTTVPPAPEQHRHLLNPFPVPKRADVIRPLDRRKPRCPPKVAPTPAAARVRVVGRTSSTSPNLTSRPRCSRVGVQGAQTAPKWGIPVLTSKEDKAHQKAPVRGAEKTSAQQGAGVAKAASAKYGSALPSRAARTSAAGPGEWQILWPEKKEDSGRDTEEADLGGGQEQAKSETQRQEIKPLPDHQPAQIVQRQGSDAEQQPAGHLLVLAGQEEQPVEQKEGGCRGREEHGGGEGASGGTHKAWTAEPT
ncbi:unnamed protein product [Vitrella brassicaformis CCMP3155]|uniref:Tyrosine-protein phosphatase domain-containing protein n=2 Tax=Vitrella brassicaformis TaxID=1169539 RepID=A0A0G4ER89_VITBC|nr:unnamed protein product [Vitrella brassicaformis CCMP3155]|eukprot:CEL99781.1 unnamed protein product [Vitrella brassicaformis CCMP3155]